MIGMSGPLFQWQILSKKHVARITAADNPASVVAVIREATQLTDNDERTMAEMDFYYYLIHFAKTQRFDPEKISCLFTLMARTHAMAISTAFDNLAATFGWFKQSLLRHSVHRPPFMEQVSVQR